MRCKMKFLIYATTVVVACMSAACTVVESDYRRSKVIIVEPDYYEDDVIIVEPDYYEEDDVIIIDGY